MNRVSPYIVVPHNHPFHNDEQEPPEPDNQTIWVCVDTDDYIKAYIYLRDEWKTITDLFELPSGDVEIHYTHEVRDDDYSDLVDYHHRLGI